MYVDSNKTRGCLSVVSITCKRSGFLSRKIVISSAEDNNVINEIMIDEIQEAIAKVKELQPTRQINTCLNIFSIRNVCKLKGIYF